MSDLVGAPTQAAQETQQAHPNQGLARTKRWEVPYSAGVNFIAPTVTTSTFTSDSMGWGQATATGGVG